MFPSSSDSCRVLARQAFKFWEEIDLNYYIKSCFLTHLVTFNKITLNSKLQKYTLVKCLNFPLNPLGGYHPNHFLAKSLESQTYWVSLTSTCYHFTTQIPANMDALVKISMIERRLSYLEHLHMCYPFSFLSTLSLLIILFALTLQESDSVNVNK